MKLKYDFTIMDMGEEFAAVPVGEDAAKFHGMLKLNAVSAEILKALKEDNLERAGEIIRQTSMLPSV
ncbi:MAG: hypothetical protein IJQ50_03950, partial [Clostridia bacterium]|nr:hypothetical protein [Clostridia bacterium]